MYQHITSEDDILIDKITELGERTPSQADANNAPKKDNGKGKADSDSDWGSNGREERQILYILYPLFLFVSCS